MIGVMLKSHFTSAGGVLGPGDFKSDETLERRFGECGHSKNLLGIPRTLSARPGTHGSHGPGPGPMGPCGARQGPMVPYIGPYKGPYIGPYLGPYLGPHRALLGPIGTHGSRAGTHGSHGSRAGPKRFLECQKGSWNGRIPRIVVHVSRHF